MSWDVLIVGFNGTLDEFELLPKEYEASPLATARTHPVAGAAPHFHRRLKVGCN